MFRATSRILLLHVLVSYICFLTFLRPVDAVLTGGNGVEVRGERGGALRAETVSGVAPKDDGDENDRNGIEWGKREMNWDEKRGGSHISEDGTDGNDWGKRDFSWGAAPPAPPAEGNDGQDWTKRGDVVWTAPPADDNNDGSEWNKRADADTKGGESLGPFGDETDDFIWNKRAEADTKDGHGEGPDETHDWLVKRSDIVPFEAPAPFAPSVGQVLKMNKRGIIEEWLHPHSMEKRQSCRDPGWAPCANSNGCCLTSSRCCGTGCKTDPADVCCSGYSCKPGGQCSTLCGGCVVAGGGCCPDGKNSCASGYQCCPGGCVTSGSKCCTGANAGKSCPAGKQCCDDGCADEGSQCCLGGGFCPKGNMCVLLNGKKGCCTDLRCTAYISDGVRVPLTPTATRQPDPTPTPPPTTAPPVTKVVDVYYTYYWTITWRYWYYYYVYWAVGDVSTVTSSQTTIYTTVTITDTASEAASAKFESISESVEKQFTTPAEATTALATPTLPAKTAGNAPTETGGGQEATVTTEPDETPVPLPSSSRRTTRSLSSITGPVNGDGPAVTGGSGAMVVVNRWLSWSMVGVAMAAGVGMVWL